MIWPILRLPSSAQKPTDFLQQRGLCADFVPPTFVADALIEHFPENPAGKQLLFPRVESGGREVLVQAMTAKGARVTEVPAYESACPARIPSAALQAIENHQADAITFASSKTVRHFAQLMLQTFGERWLELLDEVAIASIGPQTSRDCRELLGKVTLEAQEYTLAGLTAELETWAKQAH